MVLQQSWVESRTPDTESSSFHFGPALPYILSRETGGSWLSKKHLGPGREKPICRPVRITSILLEGWGSQMHRRQFPQRKRAAVYGEKCLGPKTWKLDG